MVDEGLYVNMSLHLIPFVLVLQRPPRLLPYRYTKSIKDHMGPG